MSDRSAKLLLRFAEAIELKQKMNGNLPINMAGQYDVPADVGLVCETVEWVKGYRKHVEQIINKKGLPGPTGLPGPIERPRQTGPLASDYERCPNCDTSFSFIKPGANGICPECRHLLPTQK